VGVSKAALLRLEPGCSSWPTGLDLIDGPPGALWAAGNLEWLSQPRRVAIVGTRAPSPYGETQAERFASVLVENGVVIVSGLARGIDSAAHRAALDGGGGTIAVLGCGVDRPWPAGELAERVRSDGLLLSEFEPGTAPRRHHFPLRNRLISGLSTAVLVVEAAGASGSLITARWAADQGRDVFALPGRVDHPMCRGCHRLIREGATLIESPDELLSELGWNVVAPTAPSAHRPSKLLTVLTGETLTAGEIARRLAIPIGEALVEIVRLELAGRLARAPGGLYRRTARD
jgi:DNA processing protein